MVLWQSRNPAIHRHTAQSYKNTLLPSYYRTIQPADSVKMACGKLEAIPWSVDSISTAIGAVYRNTTSAHGTIPEHYICYICYICSIKHLCGRSGYLDRTWKAQPDCMDGCLKTSIALVMSLSTPIVEKRISRVGD